MGDRKSDMDRIGLFREMGYISIGDKYKSKASQSFNVSASKGKQMLPGGSKERSAHQHGYFTDKFSRVMDGESYSDPIRHRRLRRMADAKRNIGKAFLPSNGEKKMTCPGSHYGTLSGPVTAFSPGMRAGKGYKAPGKNVLTNPGKEGTGYGYIGVTIGPYPKYQGDGYTRASEIAKKEADAHRNSVKGGPFKLNMHPQSYFDGNPYRTDKTFPSRKSTSADSKLLGLKPFKPSSPGKLPGGCKSGTFDPFPSHGTDPYGVRYKRPINVVNKSGKIFMPTPGPKSTPQVSLVDKHVVRHVNVQNYRSITIA